MSKKTILGCFFAALFLSAGTYINEACAQEPATRPRNDPRNQSKPASRPKRNPRNQSDPASRREAAPSARGTIKGAVIRKKNVRLKPGYEFVQQDANTVAVRHIATQATQGTFSCRCTDAGGCSVGVSRDTVTCVAGSCNEDCYVKVLTTDVAAPRKTISNR